MTEVVALAFKVRERMSIHGSIHFASPKATPLVTGSLIWKTSARSPAPHSDSGIRGC